MADQAECKRRRSHIQLNDRPGRFREPPSVSSLPMLAVAAVGLVVNLMAMRMLQPAATTSLNMRGAYFEVVSDLLGSIGVIVAGLIMLTTWYYADLLFSVVIGFFILPRTWKLLVEAADVLLEATPANQRGGGRKGDACQWQSRRSARSPHLDDHLRSRCAKRAPRARAGYEPSALYP